MSDYGITPLIPLMSESQRSLQPLLEAFGIITLPPCIDSETYPEILWALKVGRLLHEDEPLKLYIAGYGGEADLTFAISSLIKMDGNIEGHLIGGAHSSHGIIWASCQKRYVYPYSILGVHPVQEGNSLEVNTVKTFEQLRRHLQPYDNIIAQILSEACEDAQTYTTEYWLESMREQTTPPLTYTIDSDMLINKYGMGQPYSEE